MSEQYYTDNLENLRAVFKEQIGSGCSARLMKAFNDAEWLVESGHDITVALRNCFSPPYADHLLRLIVQRRAMP